MSVTEEEKKVLRRGLPIVCEAQFIEVSAIKCLNLTLSNFFKSFFISNNIEWWKYLVKGIKRQRKETAGSQDFHESAWTSTGGQGQSHNTFGQVYIKGHSAVTLWRSVKSRNRTRHRKGKNEKKITKHLF